MKSTESESASDEILIVDRIGVEVSIINAAAEDGAVLGDGDDAIAVFYQVSQTANCRRLGVKDQLFMYAREESWSKKQSNKRGGGNYNAANSGELEPNSRQKQDDNAYEKYGDAKLRRHLQKPEMI